LDIQHGIAFQSGENTVESIQLFKGLRPEQPTTRYAEKQHRNADAL
jgi:hypothetical protein